MQKDDEAERTARAESLTQEIDRLTSQRSQAGNQEPASKDEEETAEKEERKQAPESPRDFIHRRMHELDQQDQQKKNENSGN